MDKDINYWMKIFWGREINNIELNKMIMNYYLNEGIFDLLYRDIDYSIIERAYKLGDKWATLFLYHKNKYFLNGVKEILDQGKYNRIVGIFGRKHISYIYSYLNSYSIDYNIYPYIYIYISINIPINNRNSHPLHPITT